MKTSTMTVLSKWDGAWTHKFFLILQQKPNYMWSNMKMKRQELYQASWLKLVDLRNIKKIFNPLDTEGFVIWIIENHRIIENWAKCFCISSDIQCVTNRLHLPLLLPQWPKTNFFWFFWKIHNCCSVKSIFVVLRVTNSYSWYIFL